MNYNVIIVDNEPKQIEHLRDLLSKYFTFYNIVAECPGVPEGIESVSKLAPDIIFLDVEMPPFTGFDLLKKVEQLNFEVIFTTSFDKYAIEAIRFSALDYLLKPFGREELAGALAKFELKKRGDSEVRIKNLIANMNMQNKGSHKIGLPTGNGLAFYRIEEIVRCESSNDLTVFTLMNKEQVVVSRSLGECEDSFGNYGFCRVHNQHLINLTHVKKYIKGEGGQVLMEDGTTVDVSRRKKEEFLKLLNRI